MNSVILCTTIFLSTKSNMNLNRKQCLRQYLWKYKLFALASFFVIYSFVMGFTIKEFLQIFIWFLPVLFLLSLTGSFIFICITALVLYVIYAYVLTIFIKKEKYRNFSNSVLAVTSFIASVMTAYVFNNLLSLHLIQDPIKSKSFGEMCLELLRYGLSTLVFSYAVFETWFNKDSVIEKSTQESMDLIQDCYPFLFEIFAYIARFLCYIRDFIRLISPDSLIKIYNPVIQHLLKFVKFLQKYGFLLMLSCLVCYTLYEYDSYIKASIFLLSFITANVAYIWIVQSSVQNSHYKEKSNQRLCEKRLSVRIIKAMELIILLFLITSSIYTL